MLDVKYVASYIAGCQNSKLHFTVTNNDNCNEYVCRHVVHKNMIISIIQYAYK